jgi:hypothetical protein
MFILKNIWLILFIAWSLPITKNLVIYLYPVLNSQIQSTKHVNEELRILKELQ